MQLSDVSPLIFFYETKKIRLNLANIFEHFPDCYILFGRFEKAEHTLLPTRKTRAGHPELFVEYMLKFPY